MLNLLKKQNEKKIDFNVEEKEGSIDIKKIKKMKIPKTAQRTIPFEEIYENGLIKVEEGYYSIVIRFSNINYMLSREDEQNYKYRLYSDVLNSLDPEIHYQETLMNHSIECSRYMDTLLPKKKKKDEIEKIHEDYIKVQQGFIDESADNASEKKMYIALGYKVKTKSDNPESILKKAFRDISLGLKKLESDCEILRPTAILEIFFNYFNPFKAKEEKFLLPNNFYTKGAKIKDYIAPSSFKFKHNCIEMGTAYTRIFYVRDFPEMLQDNFISDLMDNNYDIVVSKHLDYTNKGDALHFLQMKITSLEAQRQDKKKKNKREGMDYIPFELQNTIDETKLLFKSLQEDQNMFSAALYISISAESMDKLDDVTKSINTVCRKHLVSIDVISHRQEKGLSSILPLAKDNVKITRRITTNAAAVLIPFNAQNVFNENGFYYGKNSYTKSMVVIDRKKLKNGNGFVLGIPGSGKSFKEKREVIDVLELTDDDVIVIDPEREFGGLCERYRGENIKVSASTSTNINPFDINENYGDEDDPIQTKSEFILSIIESIKSDLGPTERTIIDRCVRTVYKEFISSGWDKEKIPTLKEFYECLKEQEEKEAKDIALALELYVIGSLNTFSNRTNVTLTNRLTVFDTKDLGKQLKKLGLLIVLDYVWNKLCENKEKGKNTWIVTDEFYLYFDDRENKTSYSADYYYMIYKRSRKYGGFVTGITQNIEDVLQSPKARTMISNSQFLILLDQSPTDREILKKLLKLSETQETYITNAEPGCGLLIVGKDIIPIEDEYPKDNEIYKVITTKLDEVRKYKKEKLKK